MKIKQVLLVFLFQLVLLLSIASHAEELYLKILFGDFSIRIKTDWKLEVLKGHKNKLEFLLFEIKNKKRLASIQMLPFDTGFTKQLGKDYNVFEHKDIGKKVCYYKYSNNVMFLYLKTVGNLLIIKGEPNIVGEMVNLKEYCGKIRSKIIDRQK
ncbi:MAG: hypothetical protein Q9M92_06830 [Enterobacterales bacterium]|nr:hypothetical protein [Enterobacterales bacterium]